MAHEITVRDSGFAEAVFARTPAWHGLGTVLPEPMTSAQALEAAGLDWLVVQRPIYAEANGRYIRLEGAVANFREDNDMPLGVVTESYKVVQNKEAFEFLDALVDDGSLRYEAAFSLRGGKRVVLLARVPGHAEPVAGDVVLPYVLCSLAHDGTAAIHFGPCATRVVCANTHALALRERNADGTRRVRELSIRHVGNVKEKIAEARRIIGLAHGEFVRFAETGAVWAKTPFTREQWTQLLDVLCPTLPPIDPDYTPKRAATILATRYSLTDIFEKDPGGQTAWTAFQAVIEHIDHLPRRGARPDSRAEARFNMCLYGPGRDMKERAYEAVARITGLAS